LFKTVIILVRIGNNESKSLFLKIGVQNSPPISIPPYLKNEQHSSSQNSNNFLKLHLAKDIISKIEKKTKSIRYSSLRHLLVVRFLFPKKNSIKIVLKKYNEEKNSRNCCSLPRRVLQQFSEEISLKLF
jgi:hypothetical protein